MKIIATILLAALLQYPNGTDAFSALSSLRMTATSDVPSTSTTTTTTEKKKSRTQRIMEKTSTTGQTGGAGGSSTYDAFVRAEANWQRLKQSKAFDPTNAMNDNNNKDLPRRPTFVTDDGAQGNPQSWAKLRAIKEGTASLDYDVCICGGTLGIFFATALALKNKKDETNPNLMKICVLEAGTLQGREQEWNISRKEMEELIELGILTAEEVESIITTEFPACRSGFKNREVTPLTGGYFTNGEVGYETTTDNVLNLGVAPRQLLEIVKNRFIQELGGTVLEQTRLQGVVVSDSIGAALDLTDPNNNNNNNNNKNTGGEEEEEEEGSNNIMTSKLVLDCMGNASPISRQQRFGMKPDGVCAVVGSCASGFDAETNKIGDIIYTNTEIQDKGDEGKLQYFWEAFPVNIGRPGGPTSSTMKTTYMFTYMDANKQRPSLETLMDDYWDLLPTYQPSITNPEEDLDVHRVLFAYFPTYRDSPLKPQWSRLLAVGDASGIQSPLSFGGFGALTRHLDRISTAITEAVEYDLLTKDDLGEINAYTPNLSAAWMFQKAMSVKVGQNVDPKFVNRLLATNFEIMDNMGLRTIQPFLQDVIRIDGLVGSLARAFVADPTFMPQIVAHVGIPSLVDWLGHVSMMTLYTALHGVVSPVLEPIVDAAVAEKNPRAAFQWRRRMEAWKFGSGSDYILPEEN